MPISEKATIDKIEIFENGLFVIRRARLILDSDGTSEIAKIYNREPLEPGQDISGQPKKIRDLIAIIWTPQVISEYQTAKQAAINKLPR